MRPVFRRRQLWLKQRGDEEAVIRQLERACFAVFTECRKAQPRIFKILMVLRIDFVIAEILFFDFGPSINGRKAAAGFDPQLASAGEFWRTGTSIGDRTCHWSDDQLLRGAAVLGRIGIGDSQYVARIL